MEEAAASWNTRYTSREGFDCQITLRDDDETILAGRAKNVLDSLLKAGCNPVGRIANGAVEQPPDDDKVYFDAEGVRRCNLKLKTGNVCGSTVSPREGKYGAFWSCPNYKEHVKQQISG